MWAHHDQSASTHSCKTAFRCRTLDECSSSLPRAGPPCSCTRVEASRCWMSSDLPSPPSSSWRSQAENIDIVYNDVILTFMLRHAPAWRHAEPDWLHPQNCCESCFSWSRSADETQQSWNGMVRIKAKFSYHEDDQKQHSNTQTDTASDLIHHELATFAAARVRVAVAAAKRPPIAKTGLVTVLVAAAAPPTATSVHPASTATATPPIHPATSAAAVVHNSVNALPNKWTFVLKIQQKWLIFDSFTSVIAFNVHVLLIKF